MAKTLSLVSCDDGSRHVAVRQARAVYFAQAAPGTPIKIGESADPERRVRALRCPQTGRRLITLATTDLFPERAIHRAFDLESLANKASRCGPKEWFRPTERLLAFIASLPTGTG